MFPLKQQGDAVSSADHVLTPCQESCRVTAWGSW